MLFRSEIRYPDIAEYPQASPIIADTYRRAGVDTPLQPYPSNLIRDQQYRSQYPGLDFTGGGVTENTAIIRLTSRQTPTPETRWTGQNRGGYSNPEYDRMVDVYEGMLDAAQRDEQVIRLMKFLSDDVPSIPLYFVLRPIAQVAGLQGVAVGSPHATQSGNVHEWVFR